MKTVHGCCSASAHPLGDKKIDVTVTIPVGRNNATVETPIDVCYQPGSPVRHRLAEADNWYRRTGVRRLIQYSNGVLFHTDTRLPKDYRPRVLS
jgi:hypothetical protein